tara:strand:- start:7609 stop:9669 length:2061 start_codon:yes stop_codon:yes gene_type:complete
MSIDELGTRLVREGRRRRDRQRKRQERFQTRAAIAQIAVPVAGRIIEDNLQQKAQDFFNSEQVLNLNRQFNKASVNGSVYINNEQKIQASGGNAENYFADQNFAAAKTQLMDTLTEEQIGGPQQLNMREIDIRARAIARDMAVEQAREHREGLEIALNLGTKEEFDSELARRLKPTTPTSIVDSIGRWVGTKFGGKSTTERQLDAIDDFKRSYQFTSTEQMNSAIKEFQETNNWRSAFAKAAEEGGSAQASEYWRNKINELETMPDYKMPSKTVFDSYTTAKGERKVGGYTVDLDMNGQPIAGTMQPITPVVLANDPEAERLYNVQVANTLRSSFDPTGTDVRNILTNKGFDLFKTKVRENKREDGTSISAEDFQGFDEHRTIIKTFQQFIDDNRGDSSIITPDRLNQLEAMVVDARLKSDYMQGLYDEFDRTDVLSLQATNPEEYAASRAYYEKIEANPNSEEPEPDFFEKYEAAVSAEIEVERAETRAMRVGRYELPEELTEEIDLPTIDPDKTGFENPLDLTSPDVKIGTDEDVTPSPEVISVATEEEETTPVETPELPPLPASYVALQEEYNNAPETGRGRAGNVGRTKSKIRKELEEWEETTKEKISRLETAIEDHARGAFNRFDDVLGDIVPRVGVPIETTKKVLETLKAELMQFEEYQRFQEGQFTSPILNNSILAGAD